MRKRNAFTMIELLAVLVILGIIMAITVPTISYFLRGNSKDYYSKLEQTVASSSQDFFNDYRVNLPKDIGHVKKIGIPSLVAQKYTTDVVGIDKKACDGDVVVQKLASGNYSYTACLKCEKKTDGSYGYISDVKECGYSEENNNKYTILLDGLGDKTSIRIPQSQNYTIPNAKVYVNGQALANILKPTPSTIDVNILTTYKVYYTFRTLVKELQIKVYDPKKPVVASITAESGGASYTSGTFTNKDVKVTFLATDWTTSSAYGSGVDHFEYQINGGSVQKLNATTTDNKNYTASINLNTGGTHNISVKAIDKEGNVGDSKTFTVKIDKTAPSGTIKVASTKSDYNALTVKATLSASDNSGGSGVKQMCIRETNTLSSCSWINYALTRNMTLSGSLNGETRTIYAWFKDGAGNISSASTTKYTPYKEGTKPAYDDWSICNKKCGTGTQTRKVTDFYTGKLIKTESRNCNTMSCCSSKKPSSYGPWNSCSKNCGPGKQIRTVYYVSAYDSSVSCGSVTDGSVKEGTQTCNLRDCCSSKKPSSYGPWGACSKTCGVGTQIRTVYYVSAYDNSVSCGSVTDGSVKEGRQACNTQSCIQYRYRDIKNPTVKKTSYAVKSKTFYTCICIGGSNTGALTYTGKTMCDYTDSYPGCKILYDTSYLSSKKSYTCTPNKSEITTQVTDTSNCLSYTKLPYGGKICTQYGTKPVTTTTNIAPSCSAGTYKYCDSWDDNVYAVSGSHANITGCEKKTTTCDTGWNLSGGKCYSPWSAWSSTPVTATSTREVQTKQG